MTVTTSRRKQVARYPSSEENIDPNEKGPMVPEKTSTSASSSFMNKWSASRLKLPSQEESSVAASSSRIPRSSSQAARQEDSRLATFQNDREAMRQSSYSTTSDMAREGHVSGVVTTANAISLQRAAAHTRAAAEFVTITSPPARASTSVEKAIGVTTRRRKSREATSRRSSGGSKLISSPSDGAARGETVSKTGSTPEKGSAASTLLLKPTDATTTSTRGTQSRGATDDKGLLRGSRSASAVEAIPLSTSRTSSRQGSSSPRLPVSNSVDSRSGTLVQNHTGKSEVSAASLPKSSSQYLSPGSPTFRAERMHASSSSISRISDSLDPLSGSWGRNSSVTAEDPEDAPTSTNPSRRRRNISNASAASSLASRSALLTAKEANSVASSRTGGQIRNASTFSSTSASSLGFTTKTTEHVETEVSEKDELLDQLLASLALIDSQPYNALASIDEVESYKKELSKAQRRMKDVAHKLKVEMRVREAADKLRRAGSRPGQHGRSPSNVSNMVGSSSVSSFKYQHQRGLSTASTAMLPAESAQAEADLATAIRRTDATCKELLDLKDQSMVLQRRLLEHQTRVLALRVSSLEDERARHLQIVEEKEEDRGGAEREMVAEEAKKLHDTIQHLEQSLQHEKLERAEEIARWKQKHDKVVTTGQERLEAEKKSWRHLLEEEKKRSEATVQRMQRNHSQEAVTASGAREKLEKQLKDNVALSTSQALQLKELEGKASLSSSQALRMEELESKVAFGASQTLRVKELEEQLKQAEFEMKAERKIMAERQQLFTAFEKRLNRAEAKLREQDDRCARMLGKVDGREEMDTMLEKIKAGYGATKKEKTAGQDVDGLIDSIATHVGDLEDELHRRGKSLEPAISSSQVLEAQLEATEQQLEAWKAEAESAKRSLAAMQRQSTLSSNGGGPALSPYSRSPSKQGRSASGSGLYDAKATSEIEARLALVEKRKEVLELELAEAQQESRNARRQNPKLARDAELLNDAMHNLLSILPTLDPSSMELRRVQDELNTENKHDSFEFDDVHDVCQEIMHRCRSLLTTCTKLVDRTMASEARLEAFENALVVMESKCDELKKAMDDMRQGDASHLEKEKKLEITVNELRKSLNSKTAADYTFGMKNRFAGGVGIRSSSTSNIIADNKNYSTADFMHPARGGIPSTMARSASSGSVKSFGAPMVLVRKPSQGSSVSFASLRRSRGIPKPLSISTSNSNLSFTLSSSLPTSANRNAAPTTRTTVSPTTTRTMTTTESSTSLKSGGKTAPRSMTLGMDTVQMSKRIRQLESDLIRQTRNKSSSSSSEMRTRPGAAGLAAPVPADMEDMDEEVDVHAYRQDLLRELEEHKRELDYVKNVESRQRIDLLDELTNLTGELSEARAQLRAEQRKREKGGG